MSSPCDDEKAVAEGYGRLVSLLKDEEFADAIDSCEALLAKVGDGAEEVERTRILCLIHNTDFEEAIEAIGTPTGGTDESSRATRLLRRLFKTAFIARK